MSSLGMKVLSEDKGSGWEPTLTVVSEPPEPQVLLVAWNTARQNLFVEDWRLNTETRPNHIRLSSSELLADECQRLNLLLRNTNPCLEIVTCEVTVQSLDMWGNSSTRLRSRIKRCWNFLFRENTVAHSGLVMGMIWRTRRGHGYLFFWQRRRPEQEILHECGTYQQNTAII